VNVIAKEIMTDEDVSCAMKAQCLQFILLEDIQPYS
jgi:hypothetical protein